MKILSEKDLFKEEEKISEEDSFIILNSVRV